MLKIQREICDFYKWHKKLNNKMFVLSNGGIGDIIISTNIAKFLNTGVVQKTSIELHHDIYRKTFANEYFDFFKMPYFQISNDKETLKYIKKTQFLEQLYFPTYLKNNGKDVNKIMTEIFSLNFKNKKIKKNIFICPSGSKQDKQMDIKFFKKLIKYFYYKNYEIYCVGIKKDIEKYGINESYKWINTNEITTIEKKEKINIEKFLEITSTASLSITTETSFHVISTMLNIPTITMFKYNLKNEPILHDGSMTFFTNLEWCKKCTRLTYEEIFEYLDYNLTL